MYPDNWIAPWSTLQDILILQWSIPNLRTDRDRLICPTRQTITKRSSNYHLDETTIAHAQFTYLYASKSRMHLRMHRRTLRYHILRKKMTARPPSTTNHIWMTGPDRNIVTTMVVTIQRTPFTVLQQRKYFNTGSTSRRRLTYFQNYMDTARSFIAHSSSSASSLQNTS